MSDIKTARTELQRALKVFRAFEAADKALAVLENLDQVEGERKLAAAEAQKSLDAVLQDVAAAREDVKAAKDEAARVRKVAAEKADRVVQAANDKANEATQAASEKAAQLEASVVDLTAQRDKLAGEVAQLATDLATAKAEIAKAEKMRAALAGI